MKKQSEKVSPIKAANKHNKSPFYPPPQPKVAAGHGGFVKDPLVVSTYVVLAIGMCVSYYGYV